jgi:anaerobic ribonucleoside-triphosphate reductase activating protein
MKLQINKAHFPVTALGPGRRIGIWFQGCSIRCAGCVSQDTWEFSSAFETEIEALMGWCKEVSQGAVDGVTISGGEPFDQPEGLSAVVESLVAWRETARLRFDILCYSGYSYRYLQRRFPSILQRLDALIPEPYQAKRSQTRRWRGSGNQPILALSDLGRERYTLNPAEDRPDHRFQFVVDDERIWFVGIPDRAHMERLTEICEESGLMIEEASWRA